MQFERIEMFPINDVGEKMKQLAPALYGVIGCILQSNQREHSVPLDDTCSVSSLVSFIRLACASQGVDGMKPLCISLIANLCRPYPLCIFLGSSPFTVSVRDILDAATYPSLGVSPVIEPSPPLSRCLGQRSSTGTMRKGKCWRRRDRAEYASVNDVEIVAEEIVEYTRKEEDPRVWPFLATVFW